MWMAGGGSRPGISYMGKPTTSRTIIVMDPDHIHDFDETVNHLQGFDRRLTGVEPARVIKDLLV